MSHRTQPRKLKRVLIREEYVALTSDYKKAVLLHQLEWLQSQAYDLDEYVAEEGARLAREGIKAGIVPTNGWFRKKADALSQETLLKLSDSSIHMHLEYFIERGWLQERHNPRDKRDRTKQYRLDLVRLKQDLESIGYQLEGWAFERVTDAEDAETAISETENAISEIENGSSKTGNAIAETEIPFAETEEHYKTHSKHLSKHTHTQAARTNMDAVGVSSKYILEECRRYAEHLRDTKQGITNPGGYATTIHRSGEADGLIERFLNPPADHPHVDAASCPDCRGTGYWYPAGTTRGVAKCAHGRLSEASDKGKPSSSAHDGRSPPPA